MHILICQSQLKTHVLIWDTLYILILPPKLELRFFRPVIFWHVRLWLICDWLIHDKYVIGTALKCYKGEFVKSRDQNPMEPKLVDCDKYEDMCLSLYSGKTDWLKHCFKRSDILALIDDKESSEGCKEVLVSNINKYVCICMKQ